MTKKEEYIENKQRIVSIAKDMSELKNNKHFKYLLGIVEERAQQLQKLAVDARSLEDLAEIRGEIKGIQSLEGFFTTIQNKGKAAERSLKIK